MSVFRSTKWIIQVSRNLYGLLVSVFSFREQNRNASIVPSHSREFALKCIFGVISLVLMCWRSNDIKIHLTSFTEKLRERYIKKNWGQSKRWHRVYTLRLLNQLERQFQANPGLSVLLTKRKVSAMFKYEHMLLDTELAIPFNKCKYCTMY